MNRDALVKRARSYTRDLNNNTFRDIDLYDYINEAIERCAHLVPELRGMVELEEGLDVPTHLPPRYHYLLALYCASRLFSQDERFHQSTNLMNEFEVKIAEMREFIEAGDLEILDGSGVPVTFTYNEEHVENVYFDKGIEEEPEEEETLGVDWGEW